MLQSQYLDAARRERSLAPARNGSLIPQIWPIPMPAHPQYTVRMEVHASSSLTRLSRVLTKSQLEKL
jgi:hypothetical protein